VARATHRLPVGAQISDRCFSLHELHEKFLTLCEESFEIILQERRLIPGRQQVSSEEIVCLLRAMFLPDLRKVIRRRALAQPMIGRAVNVRAIQNAIAEGRRGIMFVEKCTREDVMIVYGVFLVSHQLRSDWSPLVKV